MKVYISCDLDGVCGVVDRDQLFDSSSPDYRHACRLLTAEVNAAVAGALCPLSIPLTSWWANRAWRAMPLRKMGYLVACLTPTIIKQAPRPFDAT